MNSAFLCFLITFVSTEIFEKTLAVSRGRNEDDFHSTLLHKLLESYDKLQSPIGDPAFGNIVVVNVTTFLTHLEWSDSELEAVFFLRQYWHDERFAEKSKNKIKVDAGDIINHIWSPSLFSPTATSLRVLEKGFISIHNGDVVWSQLWKVHTPCRSTPRGFYTNDGRLNCTITIEDYPHTEDRMRLHWTSQSHEHAHLAQVLTDITYDNIMNEGETGKYDRLLMQLKIQTMFKPDVLRFVSNSALKKFS